MKKISMAVKNRLPLILLIGCIIIILLLWQTQRITSAPTVTFTTITGKKIELAQLRGHPVIITFWATDCAGCIKEIPHLIELYNQFHPKGLEIIAVAMYYDLPSHVVAMTNARQLPYNVALDLTAEHAMAFGQVRLTPTTFLISATGNIVFQKTGTFDSIKMKQRLNNLIQG
jgi:peroxiredoxin